MAEENQADPKLYNGLVQSATNANESVHKLRTTTLQSGSGPAIHHQSFVPFDNMLYRMSQTQSNSKMLSSDMAPFSMADEESVSDQIYLTSSKLQDLSTNGLSNDALPSHEQFLKFKNTIIKGCESAESLAYFHRNRPCFKKINCLCARLKQDVDRADSVLANINSQGVPWAVKDFIFVFTRIVSAWNIIKDYVYNNSEGMRTIKTAISDRLVVSFLKWQEVTSDFVEDLTKSFAGLQELTLAQTRNGECQKNAEQNASSNEPKAFTSDTESFDSFKAMLNVECANERSGSDQSSDSSIGYTNAAQHVKQLTITSDRKFEYIKTGIYRCMAPRNTNYPNHYSNQANGIGVHRGVAMDNNEQWKRQIARTDDTKKPPPYINLLPGGATNFGRNGTEKCHQSAAPDAMEMDVRKKLKSEFLQKVCAIHESQFFFNSKFIRNYFPDFLKIVPDFMDLRSIIVKSEMEDSNNIYDIVQQIRQIFYSAKVYLQERPHQHLEENATIFEREFENMLRRDFAEHDFKRVPGFEF